MTTKPQVAAIDIAIEFINASIDNFKLPNAIVIGISGPQGSGKSYLTDQVLEYLQRTRPGLNCVGLLLDDFYLSHQDQVRVSQEAKTSGNSLLQGRGLPGTHDLPLAVKALESLQKGLIPISIPVYDKSSFGGEGDRLESWKIVDKKVDVVVFEGWMNGFRSIDNGLFPSVYFSCGSDSVVNKTAMHQLAEINTELAHYERLWNMFDKFIYLDTADVETNVYKWRLQQEACLISKMGRGMTNAQVIAFVDRYMPMYMLYYWRMCEKGSAPKGNNMRIKIDIARQVIGLDIL